jgi:hypothetical protein
MGYEAVVVAVGVDEGHCERVESPNRRDGGLQSCRERANEAPSWIL